jgi:hypothetical protein
MANISNVVQVQLLKEPQLAQRANVNTIAVFTSELGKLSSANRTEIYTDLASVADDFGTTSEFYDFASVFFQQTPNPVSANGYLVAAFWRATDETVDATAAVLTGAQLVEDTVVGELQQISDGSLDIDVDGLIENLTGLDFRTVLTLDDIADVLDTALSGATATVDNLSIVITSDTTGALSTLTFVTDPATGTYVGNVLKLATGTGASLVQGAASDVLTAETKEEALVAADTGFRSFVFIDQPTDGEREDLAAYAQANNLISGDVFSGADYLEVDATNVVWKIKLAGQTNYRMFYDKNNDRKLAIGVLSRMQTVLFTGTNTANTENLKNIVGVQPVDYTQSEINKAYNVGLDVYTTIKNVSVMLTSPANDFFDNVYNLIAYIDALETDTFNLLKAATTKIPQTVRGVNQLVDSIEKTTEGFVRAGVFAAGTWTSPELFGDPDTLREQVRTKGYYVFANRLSDQPQSDRQERKSPPIQIAVKNAAAIHKANLIVQFNI